MDQNYPLISVIILSYNSLDTLPRAIHSVLMQDYPNIELIISDDHSFSFPEEYVRAQLNAFGPNISRAEVLTSGSNTGTVANLRRALGVARGDYFTVIGSDDFYSDSGCLSAFASAFERRGDRPLAVSGKAEMWSEDMSCCLRVLPSNDALSVLQREDPEELFNRLSYECCIPIVATCFKREFVSAVNAFDDSYVYYEDYPTFIRMARIGIAPAYLDKTIVRHPAGGVANGNSSPDIQRGLYYDRRRMWAKEVNPYSKLLDSESLKKSLARQKLEKRSFEEGAGRPASRWVRFVRRKARALKSFFFSKRLHRAAQAFRFSILLVVCSVGLAAAPIALSDIMACLFSIVGFASAAISAWFFLSYVCLVCKNRLLR